MKCLISGISGIAKPGELMAIMGSSGAGKTTLLNTLSGRIRVRKNDVLSGHVLVNGKARDDRWRRTAGYVEQEDLMYEQLTVQETLQFAAELKLPTTLSVGEKRQIVDHVINLLGLNGVRFSKIGSTSKRGISGGEMKRVAIGIELVTFPGLLFLDEPTTGLDASTALALIDTLREIAQKTSMAIVLTIHQPRASILALFTKIMFMAKGKVVFNGTIEACLDHFEKEFGLHCPSRENPADFIMDTLTVKSGDEESADRVKRLQDKWAEIEAEEEASEGENLNTDTGETVLNINEEGPNSNTNTNTVVAINNINNENVSENTSSKTAKHRLTWPNNRFQEFSILLKRNFILLWRDKLSFFAELGQTIFLCLLLSFVFFQLNDDFAGVQGRIGLLFFICINIVFTTVNVLITIFAVDRAILLRERAAATYRVFPGYSAKFVSFLPKSLIFLLIFAIPLYFITGLTMPFDRLLVFLLILIALRYASIGLGLCVASFSPNIKISQIIGPLIIVIFFIFGGNLANSNEITWILRWIQYISIIFYSYQALAQNEFTGNYYGVQNDSRTLVPGSYYLALYGLDNVGEWGCFGAILGLGTFFLILGYIGLRFTTRPKMTFV